MIILMGNLGYLRGINGYLLQHLRYAYRHIYCSIDVQARCLQQVTQIIAREDPDICCFVEIDQGYREKRSFNQLESLINAHYAFYDIENKYGPLSRLRHLPLTRGKSNGFVAKTSFPYEKIYFEHGAKKLIYILKPQPGIHIIFAHFSLKLAVRRQQILQIAHICSQIEGDIALMGDFNIHSGFEELSPLLANGKFVLMNKENVPTFRFHRLQLPLDICLCSPALADKAELRIIPQPYSDHDALLLRLNER